jgi:hypothetical protein
MKPSTLLPILNNTKRKPLFRGKLLFQIKPNAFKVLDLFSPKTKIFTKNPIFSYKILPKKRQDNRKLKEKDPQPLLARANPAQHSLFSRGAIPSPSNLSHFQPSSSLVHLLPKRYSPRVPFLPPRPHHHPWPQIGKISERYADLAASPSPYSTSTWRHRAETLVAHVPLLTSPLLSPFSAPHDVVITKLWSSIQGNQELRLDVIFLFNNVIEP